MKDRIIIDGVAYIREDIFIRRRKTPIIGAWCIHKEHPEWGPGKIMEKYSKYLYLVYFPKYKNGHNGLGYQRGDYHGYHCEWCLDYVIIMLDNHSNDKKRPLYKHYRKFNKEHIEEQRKLFQKEEW